MDFEQILIRLGLDAKALTSGLTRTTSFVKGWASGLMNDLQHHVIGRLAGLYLFERAFDSIKEKALFVQRTARETGLSTNMVQGMANELGFVGESFEGMAKPLNKFNELIGEAKQGSIQARQKLLDLGIVTKAEEINSLNLTKGLIALNAQFHRVNDPAVFAAQLRQIGKGMEALFPILEMDQRKFAELDKGNFFTKLTPGALSSFAELTKVAKATGGGFVATIGNLLNVTMGSVFRGLLSSPHFIQWQKELGRRITIGEQLKYIFTGTLPIELQQNQVAHETTEAYLKRKEITEEIQKLENQIADRGKLTVEALADRARQILGDKRPRGIASLHAITPAMASAMRIQDLEDEAQTATARGQFDRAAVLQSRADQMRSNNFSLKSTEREPTKILEQHLEALKLTHQALTTDGIKVKEINTQNH